MTIPFLGEWADPFIRDPNFNTPQAREDNFIERGISNGIEKGFGAIGDKIAFSLKTKAESMAQNIPELASIALMTYLIYLGYRSFIKHDIPDFANVYTAIMVYTIFRLFWKVVLHI